jgi:hypothetical protein
MHQRIVVEYVKNEGDVVPEIPLLTRRTRMAGLAVSRVLDGPALGQYIRAQGGREARAPPVAGAGRGDMAHSQALVANQIARVLVHEYREVLNAPTMGITTEGCGSYEPVAENGREAGWEEYAMTPRARSTWARG